MFCPCIHDICTNMFGFCGAGAPEIELIEKMSLQQHLERPLELSASPFIDPVYMKGVFRGMASRALGLLVKERAGNAIQPLFQVQWRGGSRQTRGTPRLRKTTRRMRRGTSTATHKSASVSAI